MGGTLHLPATRPGAFLAYPHYAMLLKVKLSSVPGRGHTRRAWAGPGLVLAAPASSGPPHSQIGSDGGSHAV